LIFFLSIIYIQFIFYFIFMDQYSSPIIQFYIPVIYWIISNFLKNIWFYPIHIGSNFFYEIIFTPFYFISSIFSDNLYTDCIMIFDDIDFLDNLYLDYRYFLLCMLIIFLISIFYFIIIYLLWKKFNVIYKNIFKKEIIKKEISSQKANYYLIYCQLIPYLWIILTFIIWLKYKITYRELIKKLSFWLMIKVIIFTIYFIWTLITNEFRESIYIYWPFPDFEVSNWYFLYWISRLSDLIIFYVIPLLIFIISTIIYFNNLKKSNN